MKTFITVSVSKSDFESTVDDEIVFKSVLNEVMDAALNLMEAGHRIQLKITNLPLRRDEE